MGNSCIKNKINPVVESSVLNWNACQKTEYYHWWPMCESNENDMSNNLYAKGNALYKYDHLFKAKSVQYQRDHHYISKDSTRIDRNWAGFCNYSSIMSSLYSHPKYDVVVKHKKQFVTFSPKDIEQLIVIACKESIKPNMSLFFGVRNNTNLSSEEPYPLELLNMLKMMCKNEYPFVMDIDKGKAVWNYPYDSVSVNKYKTCPLRHITPDKGKTDYYNFKINSNGYPDQNQNLWGYVNTVRDKNGQICEQTEKWVSECHPDFIWSKYPIEKPWNGMCKLNPEINARIVYEIYKLSLHSYSNTLVID